MSRHRADDDAVRGTVSGWRLMLSGELSDPRHTIQWKNAVRSLHRKVFRLREVLGSQQNVTF